MLLAFDIGNTQVTAGIHNGDKWMRIVRFSSGKNKTSDKYANEINDFLNDCAISVDDISAGIISSVVPCVTCALQDAIKNIFNFEPVLINENLNCDIRVDIDDPASLGSDILCGCVAAAKKYTLPAIVFDFGSATTACIVDKNSNLLGGMIIPGLKMSLKALYSGCAMLSEVQIAKPKRLIGKNTEESIQAGVVYSNVAIIDNISQRIQEELGEKCTIVVTGGMSAYISPYTKADVIWDENLVLDGMRFIYEQNK